MDALLALFGFAVVASITPGPNNLLLATSGMRFGLRRTVPQIVGIQIGVFTLLQLNIRSLAGVLRVWPWLAEWIGVLGCAYLIYLALVMLYAVFDDSGEAEPASPIGLWQAALFQFVNPKAWLMGSTGATLILVAVEGEETDPVTGSMLFCLISMPCSLLWAFFGELLRTHLQQWQWRSLFNVVMALGLLATATTLWPIT